MEEASWSTRAWTLQEYLLSRRAIFFEKHQVFFLCKEMSVKENWTRPHTLEDIDYLNKEWADFDLPLPSGKRTGGLTKVYKRIVSMYSNRDLTFPGDRHRAFEGLESCLSRNYNVDFLHGLPLSRDHFMEALLWRHDSQNAALLRDVESPLSILHQWPSWSWLNHPGGVDYTPFIYWSHRKDLPITIDLPFPEISFQETVHRPEGLSFDDIGHCPSRLKRLQIQSLALDINITHWCDRHRSDWPPLEIWKNYSFPSARGPINFHLGIVTDNQEEGYNVFPKDIDKVRLLRLNKRDRPKLPWAVVRGELVQTISPTHPRDNSGKTLSQQILMETPLSSTLTWTGSGNSGPLKYNEFEPDACLLIIEATNCDTVSRRLGIAYARMIDFLVAGAEVKEVLLE
ncbi:hypothetical protein FE257_003300 [Aspergillus nanangensis]|uniref:Heterokaryon incompatibility domain-containing protein n=1 Tax=Aspergillus nanangensis TaxID=2582783 RepID=A0AAD4CSK8_ASPNN|nr:hypothetical protein FE257_003300 [Aspergillus nanangensis]